MTRWTWITTALAALALAAGGAAPLILPVGAQPKPVVWDRPTRPAVQDEQSRGAPQGCRGAAALLHRDAGQEGAPPDGDRSLAVAARLRPRADAHAGRLEGQEDPRVRGRLRQLGAVPRCR